MTNEKQAICDICGKVENDTPEQLASENWHLGSSEEFCPECNN
jgi:hypothetical protein